MQLHSSCCQGVLTVLLGISNSAMQASEVQQVQTTAKTADKAWKLQVQGRPLVDPNQIRQHTTVTGCSQSGRT